MKLAEGWGEFGVDKTSFIPETSLADQILNSLKPRSLVVNATGLGKDSQGLLFPMQQFFLMVGLHGILIIREICYFRAGLITEKNRSLTLVDGWDYFVIGWTQVIADIFELDIPTKEISMTCSPNKQRESIKKERPNGRSLYITGIIF